mmetsp:Transcript_20864/g.52210  ORF Transcript_20864/g.52210 Transcript_20864/m.52210 type:complete len:459 (+) Transcript_20864:62-1438(+)
METSMVPTPSRLVASASCGSGTCPSPDNATQKVWSIVRKLYRYIQPDGSVVQKIAYTCPADGCEQEFSDLGSVSAHVQGAHGVSLEASGKPAIDKSRFSIQRVRLPDGDYRLICPHCIQQFSVQDTEGLLRHAAEEHGTLCSSSACSEFRGQSEHLDLLYGAPSETWYPKRQEALQRLRIVSLGSFCSMKISIQKVGLAESHLPFDWIRSSSKGVRHFVRSDFEGFFSVASKYAVPTSNLTMYRSKHHSFWHDDIAKPEARNKLQRRIERFTALCDDPRDLLFLRSCASTDELPEVELLHAALAARFASQPGEPPRRVLLGIVIDGQDASEGPFLNETAPCIALFTQAYHQEATVAGPVYCAAVQAFVSWALSSDSMASTSAALGASLSWHMCEDRGVVLGRSGVQVAIKFSDMGLHSGFGKLMCFEAPGATHIDLQRSTEALGLPAEVATSGEKRNN